MHKIDGDANVANEFSGGDPAVPRNPTQVTPEWLNAIQDELANLITGNAGITLVKADNTQLVAALTKLFLRTGATPTYGITLTNGLIFESDASPNGAGSQGGKVRVTIKSESTTTSGFWVTLNAKWSGSSWVKDKAGPALGLFMKQQQSTSSQLGIQILQCSAASPFAQSSWIPWSDDFGGLVGLVATQEPVAPTLINSWANAGSGRKPAGYYVDPFGQVHLEGTISGGTNGTVAFTLPATHTPTGICLFPIAAASGTGSASVNASGDVAIISGSTPWSLDGIVFGR